MSRLPALRAGSDFRRVYARGRKARRDGVTVFVAEGPGPETRTGIVVPARVGTAVDRNRIKRRVRAVLGGATLPESSDLVVRIGPSAGPLRFQELEKHLVEALHSAGGAR